MKSRSFGILLFLLPVCLDAAAASGYVTGDFHQHTTYTDGSYSFGKMMVMNHFFGLDWWANSEHGGGFDRNGALSGLDMGTDLYWSQTGATLLGDRDSARLDRMWRWQSIRDWSFKDVLYWRTVYPEKVILQGLEMNVPGHDHASVCMVEGQYGTQEVNADAVAQFEYLFDDSDFDKSEPSGWVKDVRTGHAKTLDALHWLVQYHPTDSWFILNHPERFKFAWPIDQVRDMNNIAPRVFFGFTSIPGHQRDSSRGGYYTNFSSYGGTTYGGTGWMAAKVGGYWDALLSEGRSFWLFANSDCHNAEGWGVDFYPGEYLKTYTWVQDKTEPMAIVDGLRSGNSYVVMGDLIDSLDFRVGDAVQGGTFASQDDSATVCIRLHDPVGKNNNIYGSYDMPALHHVDLIEGLVTGRLDSTDLEAYRVDTVGTTKVVARFSDRVETDSLGLKSACWTLEPDGWRRMSFKVALTPGIKHYYRLRGTNKTLSEPGETDGCGNPLADVNGSNSAEAAFSDLWFYSNPVFATSAKSVSVSAPTGKMWEAWYHSADKVLVIRFKNSYIGGVEVVDMAGKCILRKTIRNADTCQLSLNACPSGIYSVCVNGQSQKIAVK